MTDSAISNTSEDDDEEPGEDLGDLDDLLAWLKKEDKTAAVMALSLILLA